MSDHVVSQLDLHVEGPDVSRADSALAQRFTHAVLERAFDLIERRLNGRILAIRRLPFRICLAKSDFSDSNAIDDAARDLAAVLERHLQKIPADPAAAADASASLLLFQTPAHQQAAALDLLAREIPPWFAPQCKSVDQALVELCEDPAIAVQVLLLLEEQSLYRVLRAAAPSTLKLIWQLLYEKSTGSTPPSPASNDFPSSSPAQILLSHPTAPLARLLQTLQESLEPSLPAPAAPSALSTRDSTDGLIVPPPIQFPLKPDAITDHSHVHIPDNPDRAKLHRESPRDLPAPPSIGARPTAAAGLFYLLNPALELDAGEILWRAGVDEPMIFTDAARLLATDAPSTDPAFTHFGGTTTSPANWQQSRHVATALLSALAAIIERRKLASRPLCVCHLSLQGMRATLVALPPHIPCLAIVPDDANSLPLDLWPFGKDESSTCHADSIPIANIVEEYLASADAADLPRRAIAVTVAGSVSALASLRLMHFTQEPPSLVLTAALRTPGQLDLRDDQLTVRIASDDLLLPIRRAGLDRDPGWIPWQKRHVRFEFFEADPAASKAEP